MEDVRATYTISKALGHDQFGVTYLVTHKTTHQQFAYKSIAMWKLINKDDIDDVRRQVQIMHHLTGHRRDPIPSSSLSTSTSTSSKQPLKSPDFIIKTHYVNVVPSKINPTLSVYKLLECPVCTNSMYPPIHQTLCSTCKTLVNNKCPTCRQELGDIGCLALEKATESLELPCKYSSLSCHGIFPYYSKHKHEVVCNFRPYSCP
uniref:RING-type E3 ubiquitin transferase n=1 Tax=Lactuca sativa TaxID=4236 RepID=A0A9R1WVB6_LACSA|nr:hypothetical protein LSAT_V11C900481420 [Lactuca sativa]